MTQTADTEQRIQEIRAGIANAGPYAKPLTDIVDYIASVPAQIKAAIEEERSACAEIALRYCAGTASGITTYERIARAIRSRGEESK